MKGFLVCAGALVLVASCKGATEPARVRELGVVAGYRDGDPQITLRTAGRTVYVSVLTYGGGCESKGETESVVRGLEAEIRPYDYTVVAGTVCTSELKVFAHEAALEFRQSGTARVRIYGIDNRGRTAQEPLGDTITVERTIVLP